MDNETKLLAPTKHDFLRRKWNAQPTQFPLHVSHFPINFQSSLMAAAFQEVKTITQAPESMVYLSILSTVSTSLQGLINVKLPMGKICPVSLFTLIIAESGERKSTVENMVTKGVKRFQKQVIKQHKIKLKRYKTKFGIHQNKEMEIKRSLKTAGKTQYEEIVDKLIEHQENEPVKPTLPLIICEDSTIEALLSVSNENIPNVYLGSSEGGILLNSRIKSFTAILNSLWSGDDVTVNRKLEESYTLEEARLVISIMTQWSAFERFFMKTKDDVRGNGFLSRFIVCAPYSNCGFRQSKGINYSQDGLEAFHNNIYRHLLEAAELDDYTDKKVIEFSDEAKEIWLDVYNDIEFKMGPNGVYEHVKDHASKLPENIARVAGLIHYFDNSSEDAISVATLMEAINLMGYFSNQFMNVFCAPPKCEVDAENLMRWLNVYINSGVRYIKRNNILQFGPSGTRKKADLEAALEYLKPNFRVVEILSRKTRVLDLFPSYQLDEAKLKQDLSLEVIL